MAKTPVETIEERRQHAFTLLKNICVPILSLARDNPTPAATKQLLGYLTELTTALSSIEAIVFTPALANYVFFPLSSLLQPGTTEKGFGDRVLEATMISLEVLIRKWRSCDVGMETRILVELWIMSVLVLGGPLDPTAPGKAGKGKGKALSEEVEFRVLKVVKTIMVPIKTLIEEEVEVLEDEEDDDDPLGESIDWSVDDPSPETTKSRKSKSTRTIPPSIITSPPLPILFHTLTTLLAISTKSASLPSLQLTAIETLAILLEHYLVPHPPKSTPSTGPSPLIATALPGTASALARIILSAPNRTESSTDQARRQSTPAIVAALSVFQLLLKSTLDDELTKELRSQAESVEKANGATLEELVEIVTLDQPEEVEEVEEATEEIITTTEVLESPKAGPTLPTASWLRHTILKITTLLTSFIPLASHSSPLVRIAFAELLTTLLNHCSKTFGSSKLILIEGLLTLSGDSWPGVSTPSKTTLLMLFDGEKRIAYTQLAMEIIKNRLVELPRALLRSDEKRVTTSTRVIVAGLDIITSTASIDGIGSGPLNEIERWSWSLLRALTFDQVIGASKDGQAGAGRAWITSDTTPVAIDSTVSWPTLSMTHVREVSTTKELESLWESLGRWSETLGKENEIVEQFLGMALGAKGSQAAGPSALFVLDGVLRGFTVGKSTKGRKKVIRNVIQGILELFQSLEDSTESTSPLPTDSTTTNASQELIELQDEALSIQVERRKGAVSLTPTLDTLKPVVSTLPDSSASSSVLLRCLSLRILSTCATILSSSFQPYLLQVLYHVLANLSPASHPLLSEHAEIALARISYSSAYASPENLILANVDYVVNSVSQRLSISNLNPSAPLVLVEMIRLVGEPIIPMVQDLVEDVFEALDDYHGYDEITVGLWAVLDALTRVMVGAIENPLIDPSLKSIEAKIKPSERDWKSFVDWYKQRDIEAAVVDKEIGLEDHPRVPFGTTLPLDEDIPEPPQRAEELIPPTRPESITAQILSKALYFLSHSSPFLRSKVLALMTTSIPLLTIPSNKEDPNSSRQSDLLPIIHRAWPFIINRLTDKEIYVVLEASTLIETLAKNVGKFMSKRILNDVWPKFKSILQTLASQQSSTKSDNVVGIGGGGSGLKGKQIKFSSEFKIVLSILRTVRFIINDVQLKESTIWEMSMTLRRFLSAKMEVEIVEEAKKVFKALGTINSDIVWMVLSGSIASTTSIELPIYLRIAELKEGENKNILLLLNELQDDE